MWGRGRDWSCSIWYFFPDGFHFRRQPEHHSCLSFAETSSPQIRACFHLELLFLQLLLWRLLSCLGPCFVPPSLLLLCLISFTSSFRVGGECRPMHTFCQKQPRWAEVQLLLTYLPCQGTHSSSVLPDLNPTLRVYSI